MNSRFLLLLLILPSLALGDSDLPSGNNAGDSFGREAYSHSTIYYIGREVDALSDSVEELRVKVWDSDKEYSVELKDVVGQVERQGAEINARFNAQEKLLDIQNTRIDQSLTIVSLLVSGLGFLFAVFGFIGYFSVRNKAVLEAKDAADHWFREKSRGMHERLAALELEIKERASKAKYEIDEHIDGVKSSVETALQEMREVIDKTEIDAGLVNSYSVGDSLTKESSTTLQELERDLKKKPEAEYSFHDWNKRAFAAYSAKDNDGAARYWRQAAGIVEKNTYNRIKALSLAGLALTAIDRRSEAESIYDEILMEYSGEEDFKIKVEYCKVLLNKASLLQKKNKFSDAFDIYKRIELWMEVVESKQARDLYVRSLVGQLQVLINEKEIGAVIDISRKIRDLIGDAGSSIYRAWYVGALLSEGGAFLKIGILSSAEKLCAEAMKRCDEVNDERARTQYASAHDFMRVVCLYSGRIVEAVEIAKKACEAYVRCGAGSISSLISAKTDLASALRNAGDIQGAKDSCKEIINIAKESKDFLGLARAYMLLSSIESYLENLDESENLILQADQSIDSSSTEMTREIHASNRVSECDIVIMRAKAKMARGESADVELARAKKLCEIVDMDSDITFPANFLNRAWLCHWEGDSIEVEKLLDKAIASSGRTAFYCLTNDMLRQPLDSDLALMVALEEAWERYVNKPEIAKIIESEKGA